MKLKYTLRGMGIGLILTSLLYFFLHGSNKKVMGDEEIIKRAKELGMVTAETMAENHLDQLKEKFLGDKKVEEKLKAVEETPEKEEKDSFHPKKEGMDEKVVTPSNQSENKGETLPEKTEPSKIEGNKALPSKEEEKIETEPSNEIGKQTENAGTKPSKEDPSKENSSTANSSKESASQENSPKKEASKLENEKPIKSYTYKVIPGSSAVRLCNDLQAMGLIKDAKDFNQYLAKHNYATKIRNGTFTFYSNEDYYTIAEKLISRKLNP